ncbi:kinase-like domain-containing protein [Collybia nuda]|uniref:Kinase-like domain-containing protein n=1 Tax=Collybia nuda TaxID=64659 RepID=A0A9P5XU55_9AGAR|nr:kinase-like domain-containing protein [Collybia nuda]
MDHDDPRITTTLETVKWDILADKARRLLQVKNATWGHHTWGAYNLVRFLHLDDTVIVARIPLEWKGTPIAVNRMKSEVATMEYMKERTNIPIPHILEYSTSTENIGTPYILMSKAEGVPLSSVWNDMEDEKRESVLKQVVNILLDLSEQRFDKMGSLFRGETGWEIRSESEISEDALDTSTFADGLSYWIAFANAHLKRIRDQNFGKHAKEYEYAQAWFMRSVAPQLYDPADDIGGLPLCPGDFHSQNILVNDDLHITAILDWEGSATSSIGTFAIYPFFIVDHPMWEDDDPLCARNVRDQATFNRLMRAAEGKRNPNGNLPLSIAFEGCQGRYLFEQAFQFPYMYSAVYPLLFAHIYGEDDEDSDVEGEKEETFSAKYYWALMEHGVLQKLSRQFDQETKLLQNVRKVLGEEIVYQGIDRAGFKEVVSKHLDRLSGLDLHDCH